MKWVAILLVVSTILLIGCQVETPPCNDRPCCNFTFINGSFINNSFYDNYFINSTFINNTYYNNTGYVIEYLKGLPNCTNSLIGTFGYVFGSPDEVYYCDGTNWLSLDLNCSCSYSGSLSYWNKSGTDVFLSTTTDQVGIGTTSPSTALEVIGGIKSDNISVNSGSAISPSYTFSSDTDTGIYRVGSNEVGISTGGIHRFSVHNGGIEVNGAATISGNFTANFYQAEMWNYTPGGVGYLFNIDTFGIYYNLTGLIPGELNGFNFTEATQLNGGSYLTTEIRGTYAMNFHMSFGSEANGGLYGISIAHNHDRESHRDCYARRQAAIAVGSVSVTCLMHLEVGDKVAIQIESEDNDRDIYIHSANLNLVRIGD